MLQHTRRRCNRMILTHTLLMFASICLLETAGKQVSENTLSQIQSIYHQAIRMYTNQAQSSLSNSDIDEALRIILQRQQPSTEMTESHNNQNSISECQPRPYIINQEELKSHLMSTSRRIRALTSDFQTTQDCVTVHRCMKNGGCCPHGSQCSILSQETITIDIDVQIWATNEYFVETVEIVNHTDCSCQTPIQSCVCPHPLVSSLSADRMSCDCICPSEDSACKAVLAGSATIQWGRGLSHPWTFASELQSYRLYKQCVSSGMQRRHRLTGLVCPGVPCDDGLTFNLDTKMCELDIDTTVASSTTSIRVPRDSEHVQDTTEAIIVNSSTPGSLELPSTVLPLTTSGIPNIAKAYQSEADQRVKQLKRKMKWRSRIEEKLNKMQYNGIDKFTQSDNRLIKKLRRGLSNPDKGRQLNTQCPNERLFEFDVKGVSIQCRSISKQYYHIIDMSDDVLFCNLDVT